MSDHDGQAGVAWRLWGVGAEPKAIPLLGRVLIYCLLSVLWDFFMPATTTGGTYSIFLGFSDSVESWCWWLYLGDM